MTDSFSLGGELTVRRLGFGAMRLHQDGWQGAPRDPATARLVLRRVVELGVNHLDTAGFYRTRDGRIVVNELIREALHPYPPGLVIATKVGPVFGRSGASSAPASGLRALVEDNLRTLGVETLDLVYLRMGSSLEVPRGEPLGERFAALSRLREAGLIRHLGLSNVDAAHLAEARAIAPVAAVQNQLAVSDPADLALLATCERAGIAFVPYGPLGGGHAGRPSARLRALAERRGATIAQLQIAALLGRSSVMLAIPGTGSVAHLEENLRAGTLRLTPDEVRVVAA